MSLIRVPTLSVKTEISGESGHPIDGLDEALAKRAADALNKHYPGHLWAVFVNSEQTGGVMVIKNLRISFRYGMVLHLRNVQNDPQMKSVIRMGGELLERAHMKRGMANGQVAPVLEGAKAQYQPRPKLGVVC